MGRGHRRLVFSSVRRRVSVAICFHIFDDRLSLVAIVAWDQHAHSNHVPPIGKLLSVQGSIEVYGADIVQLVAH
jgi:hypothetical protein